MGDELITITKAEYFKLLDDQAMLDSLIECGVDNWDGFDYALELQEQDETFGTN